MMTYRIQGPIFLFAASLCLLAPAMAESGTAPVNPANAAGPDALVLPNFSALVRELSASVVNVSVDGMGTPGDEDGEKDPVEPKKDKENELPFRSAGSGFIVSEDGSVVTNHHVVGNADHVVVRLLNDKTEYQAEVVGRDKKTDLALLKIKPNAKLKPVKLGDSDVVEVGEWVLAIGNQFQLGQTVTAGIVSAKSRKVPSRTGPYDSFIQTDASINPGSSGGPLFNTKGEVVGINSAIFSPGRTPVGGSGFNIGIGFSIPINLAKNIIKQLEQKGKVTRGMLGVLIQPIDSDVAEAMGLSSLDGALVADVLDGTPAVKAGFKRQDVIVRFDGHPIKDFDDLPLMVANTPIGAKVQIDIIRSNRPLSIEGVIEELKEKNAAPAEVAQKPNDIGLTLQELSPELAKTLGLAATSGLIVSGVEAGSVAERSGLSRGDIIEEFVGQSVKDLATFNRILAALPRNKPALLSARKRDGVRILVLKFK